MVGCTVRVTSPSRSRPRSVSVSIRCEMLPRLRRISLNRLDPPPSSPTTNTVHLSPIRCSTSLTCRHSSGTWRVPGMNFVPSCLRRAVIYLALVTIDNLVTKGNNTMAKFKVAVIVGSNRRDSINKKLSHALAKLGSPEADFSFVQIDDLPIYNQDHEVDLPKPVARLKAEIAAADAVLFVTPEHSRSIPAVLKNAIDWG